MKNSFDSQILGRHAAPIELASRRAGQSFGSFVHSEDITDCTFFFGTGGDDDDH